MKQYDAIVIGGGFFGIRTAIFLAENGKTVLLMERDRDLMQRASYVNQARVHGGYHYPRSLLTALRSRINLPTFAEEYGDCIDKSFEKYYAVAHQLSKVSAAQFHLFAQRIEAPIKKAPSRITKLFDDRLIEDVFEVTEYAFDSLKIKNKLILRLDELMVDRRLDTEAVRISPREDGLIVQYKTGEIADEVGSKMVFNCTYAQINSLNRLSGIEELPLKYEVAELALIEPPEELEGLGITVMCGPFFSTMPFPSRDLYSFSHVRYTPHTEWRDEEQANDPYSYLGTLKPTSAFPKMLADAKRYMPCLSRSKHIESLYEIKTVLLQSEADDSRPILYKKNHGLKGYTCIMGGKLDNIYDVLKELPR